jgi:hypothetical protein
LFSCQVKWPNFVRIGAISHYGPIVSFVLEGKAQAERFLAACHLILQATSFGGVHTTAERRARWGGDAIADGFIRLSAGCEDTQDLLDDLLQAFDTLSTICSPADAHGLCCALVCGPPIRHWRNAKGWD